MVKQEKKSVVISAVNLSEGGPLTIIREVLDYLEQSPYGEEYRIYGLVHSQKLFPRYKNITLLEYPPVKSSWFRRLVFEYHQCKGLSRQLDTYLWFSLHDISPNVSASRRAVYCHNASPFYRQKWTRFFETPLRFLYTRCYSELYRINIRKNDYVVVQQQWMRNEFIRMFGLPSKKVAVALPETGECLPMATADLNDKRSPFLFFYPALPREFKNFEVLCEAASQLEQYGMTGFEVILTMDGSENVYARSVRDRYNHIKSIKFVGLQTKDKVEWLYANINCLIFPSVLESWGLPISEFKRYHKPMLVADLPYAYETTNGYKKVRFFNPHDAKALAQQMALFIKGEAVYNSRGGVLYDDPVCRNWEELFKILMV